MILALPFAFKAILNAVLTFFWLRGRGRVHTLALVASMALFFLILNLFPHGFIDIRSGNYIESGSLLLVLILYISQSLILFVIDGKKLTLQLDLIVPLTMTSALARYGTFDLAEIISRQKNIIDFGVPLVGLAFDPINAAIFFWICLVKFKILRDKRHICGVTSFDIISKLHLYTLLLIGLYVFLGGPPPAYEFNIQPIYNSVIQSSLSSAYLLIYIFIAHKVLYKLSNLYYPMSGQDVEQALWVRVIPASFVALILSLGLFIFTGGRF